MQFLPVLTLLTFTLLPSTHSTPIPGPGLPPNQSTCTGYVNAFWDVNRTAYKVTVGRPYLDGARCGAVRDLISEVMPVRSLRCRGTAGKTNTVLTLTTGAGEAERKRVNEALRRAYPGVEFGCPVQVRL
jgi:hypothetical protein